MGLSRALHQLCDLSRGPRRGSAVSIDESIPTASVVQSPSMPVTESLLHWTMTSPSQLQRIEKLISSFQQASASQQEMKKCDGKAQDCFTNSSMKYEK